MKRSRSVCFCALLLASVFFIMPALASYPMFHYDVQRSGNVSGIAPETDTLLWQSNEKTAGCIQAGPIVYDGKVYISTWWSSGKGVEGNAVDAFYCLDKDSGEEIWNNTEVYGASTAAIADGKLFVGTHRGNITCVDATNGAILWSKKIEEEFWGGVTSSPLVFDDKVYVLSPSDGTLHAFSFTGTELWKFSTGGEIFCYASPSAYGSKIFFAGNNSGQHALYCIDLSTHVEVWNFTTETEIRGSPTIWSEAGMVFFTTKYVSGKAHKLYAVNITTRAEVWNVTHDSSWASPALSKGKIYVGGSGADTTFYCYDAKDGSLIWKNEEMGGAIDSSPVVADGKVYFGTNEVDGTVYALNANNGSIVWNYTLHIPPGFGGGYNVASHPSISDHTLFIGADNVGVLAFRDSAVFWEGNVILIENTTFNVTPHNNLTANYTINRTTALGALYAAAEAGGFNYTVSDEWYASWGSLLVDSTAGKENDPVTWDSWLYWVNYPDDPMPMVGVNLYEVEDGDVVTYYYGGMSTTPDNSSMVIRIHVHVQSPAFWEGEVTLIENTTVNVTAHNSGESYEINQTTALGALDAAAEAGGFNYTVSDEWYASWGSLLVDSIAGKENDPVTWDGWMYWVNYPDDPMPIVGANLYEVEGGDVVTFYYGGMSTTPDNSSTVIRIHVHVQSPVFWEGDITLIENATFTVTAHNSGESYEINQTIALGALDAAAEAGGFNYTVSDEWYASWGSLLVDSIAGKENDPVTWDGWMYWVNYPDDPMPIVGANLYEVEGGDVVTFYYGGMSTTPDNSSMVIKIGVQVPDKIFISGLDVTDGERGGNATAWVNVTALADGWYVIVVSGVNENGEAIAGISTLRLAASESLRLPAIIPIPQQVQTGNYALYAGVYRLDDYPNNILHLYGYDTCKVS